MPYGMGLFLRTLILAGAVFASMTAVAQNAGPAGQPNIIAPRSSTGIAAIVNGDIISNYDVDQRTALFLATSGVRPTAEDLPKIRAQVLRSLEDELLQLQEANRHKIGVTKGEVDKALQSIADRQQDHRRSDHEHDRTGGRFRRRLSPSRSPRNSSGRSWWRPATGPTS